MKKFEYTVTIYHGVVPHRKSFDRAFRALMYALKNTSCDDVWQIEVWKYGRPYMYTRTHNGIKK